jgi:plasmid replication initiation protein
MNKVVKYHNDLNKISMRKRTSEEMDLFFSIISKIKDKGTKKLEFNALELKKLTGTETRNTYWFNMLDNFTTKAICLFFREQKGTTVKKMSIFDCFAFDFSEKKLMVEVSPKFEYIANELTKNFTVYELAEFTKIRSTYAKTMYRLIKQWRTVGSKKFEIEEFKEILEIPKNYTANNIQQRVIAPIKKELPAYFVNFKVKIIKANTQGNPITGYKFTWQAEQTSNWIQNKYPKKAGKKKRYRSKNGSIEAKEFAERAREERFARMLAEKEKEKEQGQTGEEILEEMQNLNNKKN